MWRAGCRPPRRLGWFPPARVPLSGVEQGDAIERGVGELREALDAMDAVAAHAVLDGLVASFTLETVLAGVVLPYLRELGERWQRGEASVAQEHFASNLLRARLLALARGWERGEGRTALLACAPGEQHDLPLIAFGLALRGRGWRIVFLGADSPAASIAETAERLRPALVVVSSVTPRGFRREADAFAALAREHRLVIAGAGADRETRGVARLLAAPGRPGRRRRRRLEAPLRSQTSPPRPCADRRPSCLVPARRRAGCLWSAPAWSDRP